MKDIFQVMPALTTEELVALEADIAERGIVVPVVVDQHGRTLDGHHRRDIAARLGIDCPSEVRHVTDDEDARTTALALNLTRRHLSREQRRELIARECQARPGDSDRVIARRLGCSPSTVATVRRPVSNLDIPEDQVMVMTEADVAEMREVTDSIEAALGKFDESLLRLPRIAALRLLRESWQALEHRADGDEDFLGPLRRHVYEPRLDMLLAAGAQ